MGNFDSTFLVGKPSYVEGVARLLDFAGALNRYNRTATPGAADLRALSADWHAIGDDIARASIEDMQKRMPGQ